MNLKTQTICIVPVLPSSNIERDVVWYNLKAGFEVVDQNSMYASIKRDNLYIHLQWHADTESDPLLGGSVIRIYVKNIQPMFKEFVERGTVDSTKFFANTSWGTNEFCFSDLNTNAIFIAEEIL